MRDAFLEHVNITVADPDKTAELLCRLFDWKIRWSGGAIHEGRSVHVGTDECYVALYSSGQTSKASASSYHTLSGLNHIGVVVEDLDSVENRIKQAGYETHSHADYEPGRRFYFSTEDDVEIEVVSYG